MSLPKQCNYPGCKVVVYDGNPRCNKHRKDNKDNYQRLRSYRNKSFYDSQEWRKLSKLKRTITPLCEVCLYENITTPAEVADHIREIEDRPDLKYCINNLMSLCRTCHNIKTNQVAMNRNKGTLRKYYCDYFKLVDLIKLNANKVIGK
ncbi:MULTISPECIES: HNH endonuclease [Vibrio]|uniref:HNH endonuclease n=1 Tax=Vibrio TaxID=662 RepID=UPI002075D6F8|nr:MULTISPECIES: HNH endonuclease [Vibrio]USD32048.1 HNH endonuclease [Vibrio sp. SCSIO 43186]USD45089.1 HNH endonuclease [Vibrio sp. SCSIO 43145]USD69171.1 HNH endonuclease [Vibrio sp. SCSIO 43139]USD96863.1 hypothetical protein CTT30_12600 [Vibrio coralliilyticus]